MRITKTSPVSKRSNKCGFAHKVDGSMNQTGSLKSGCEVTGGQGIQQPKLDVVLDQGNYNGRSAVQQCEVREKCLLEVSNCRKLSVCVNRAFRK